MTENLELIGQILGYIGIIILTGQASICMWIYILKNIKKKDDKK